MTTQIPVIKNGAGGAIIYTALDSQATAGTFQVNPTLVAGDAKISIDGGAFNNLATPPAVTPAGGKAVKITLSQAETAGDNLVIMFSDAAGAEWLDQAIHVMTAAQHFDDLATASSLAAVQADTDNLQTRVPAALVGGKMDSNVGTFTAGAITAAAFTAGAIDANALATDAIGSAELAASAVTKMQAGLATAAAVAAVQADTDDVQARLPAALVGGKIDANLGTLTAGAITAAAFAAGAIDANAIATDAIGANELAASAVTEIQAGLATSAAVAAVPTAIQNADAFLDRIDGVETGLAPRGFFRLAAAVLFGKASGMATTTAVFRSTTDATNRVTATVDVDGNRSAVTLNP